MLLKKQLLFFIVFFLPLYSLAQVVNNDCLTPNLVTAIPYTDSASSCGKGNDFATMTGCDAGLNNLEDVVYAFKPPRAGHYEFYFQFYPEPGVTHTTIIRSDCNFDANTPCKYYDEAIGFGTGGRIESIASLFLVPDTTYYIKIDGFAVPLPAPLPSTTCVNKYRIDIREPPRNSNGCIYDDTPVLPIGTTRINTGQMGLYNDFIYTRSTTFPACTQGTAPVLTKNSRSDIFKVKNERGLVVAISDAEYVMTVHLLDKTGCKLLGCFTERCAGVGCATLTGPTYPRGTGNTFHSLPAFNPTEFGVALDDSFTIAIFAEVPITLANLNKEVSTTDANQYYDITVAIKPDNTCATAPKAANCATYSISNNFDSGYEAPVFGSCPNFSIENSVFYQFCTNATSNIVTLSLDNIRFLNDSSIYKSVEFALLEGACGQPMNVLFCQQNITANTKLDFTTLNPNSCYWLMFDGANGGRFNLDFNICQPKTYINLKALKVNRPCMGDSSGYINVLGTAVTNTPQIPVNATVTWNTNPVQTGYTATGLTDGTYRITATTKDSTTFLDFTLKSSKQVIIDKVEVSGAKCDDKTIKVLVFAQPEVFNESVAFLNDTIKSIKLTNNGATFYWQFDSISPGSYNLKVVRQDADNCRFDSLLQIANSAIPKATVKITDVSCFGGNDGRATIIVNGGTPPYTFNIGGSQPVGTDTLLKLKNLQARSTFLIISDQNDCKVRPFPSLIIKQPPRIITKVVDDFRPFCSLSNGRISVVTSGKTAPYQYAIDDKPLIAGTDSFNYVYDHLAEGKHFITVKDNNECVDTFSYKLASAVPNITSKSVTSSPATCEEDLGKNVFLVNGGFKPYKYQLDNDSTLWSTTDTVSFNLLAPGEHRYKLTDSLGCEYFEKFTVKKVSTITDIAISSTAVNCEQKNGTISIDSLKGGMAPFTYRLAPLYDNFSTQKTYTNLDSGTYKVVILYKDDCIDSSKIVRLNPKPIPTANFRYEPDGKLVLVNNYGLIEFIPDTSADITSYTWDFGNNSTDSSTNPTSVYTQPGTYTISLTVENADGCIDTFSKKLATEDKATIYAPDAFSPNGDTKNDTWELRGINIVKLDVKVFNRWGEYVFNSDSFDIQWNGKAGDNIDYPQGTYVYLIEAATITGEVIKKKGTVSITR